MKVTQKEGQRVVIELESLDETVALWAVSAHVGGNQPKLRRFFSRTPESETPGLYEMLTPLVRQHLASISPERHLKDLRIHSLLNGQFGTRLSGRLNFNNVTPKGE